MHHVDPKQCDWKIWFKSMNLFMSRTSCFDLKCFDKDTNVQWCVRILDDTSKYENEQLTF